MFDFAPVAAEMSRLVVGVRDNQLDQPTPCPDWTVADLLAHIHQFARMFTATELKQPQQQPIHSLVADWRTAIPNQLDQLARAARQELAWQGRVSVGPIEMDAADHAVAGVYELTVHEWDLARATKQDLHVDDPELDHVERFFEVFPRGIFGTDRTPDDGQAPDDATRLERMIVRAGRDLSWKPAVGRS